MKLTSEQKKRIRQMAMNLAGRGNVTLELGFRCAPGWEGVNIDEEPEDADLFTTIDWANAVKDKYPGDCTMDWYVYSTGYDGQLETNLITRFRGGKLVAMYEHGPGGKALWEGEV